MASLAIELASLREWRQLEVRLNGRLLDTLHVAPTREVYQLGPFDILPGTHTLAFHPLEPPSIADSVSGHGDTRRLSFAVGTWRWTAGSERP